MVTDVDEKCLQISDRAPICIIEPSSALTKEDGEGDEEKINRKRPDFTAALQAMIMARQQRTTPPGREGISSPSLIEDPSAELGPGHSFCLGCPASSIRLATSCRVVCTVAPVLAL